MKKFWAVFVARNKEFVRDRASLSWNLVFPFLVIFGFSFIFSGDGKDVFKVGVLGEVPSATDRAAFYDTRHIQFVVIGTADDEEDALEDALHRVSQHRFDLLIEPGNPMRTASDADQDLRYWVNSSSPKGHLIERILWGSSDFGPGHKQAVDGDEIRYIDWFIPGLLSMNMMFGAIFGVGFVIVRYRKMGVLRRLKATPLSAFEFLSAQVASRLVLILGVTLIVYIGSNFILHFQMSGSYLNLFIVFTLGAICMVSLGLLIAARTASEELAGGLVNLVTIPMMILSGVWFSLDGAPQWVTRLANILPLTHVNVATRAVMTDGASLLQVLPQISALAAMTLVFLTIGAVMFRWE